MASARQQGLGQRHPELSFEEHRTSALVAERLAEWGFDVTTDFNDAIPAPAATYWVRLAERFLA